MKLGHIEFYVRDVSISRDFYRDLLAFEVTVEQLPHLVWLEKDGLELLLRQGEHGQESAHYEDSPSGMVFYTEDLPAAVARLESLGLEFKGTVDSDKCLTFTDPDGHWFQLVNPEDL